jgi:DNA-binding CsgD family transcriptional regulator
MRAIEFYTTPEGDVMIRELGGIERRLSESDRDFIVGFNGVIEEFYPEAYSAMKKAYAKSAANRVYNDYLIARRFIKCNFGNYDNMIDLDENWNFHFEFVGGPLRGECTGDRVICQPKFCSKMSDRQMDVMRMCYNGKNDEEIAESLYITLDTVRNHRKNVFRKLNLHSMSEFMRYAHTNNLFK